MPHLCLIGPRGSGKTTVGAILAARLAMPFIDLDEAIEGTARRTIAQIFADEGEEGFRERERQALANTYDYSACVVATGGGVVLNELNRDMLRAMGFVAWLTAPPDVLWQRMLADPLTATRRPNLRGGGLAEVEALVAQREPLYAATAHARFDVAASSPEAVADAILHAYETHAV